MSRRRRIVAVILISGLVASGCSSTDAPDSPAAVADARPGGTLRVGILEPRTIAPWLTSTFDPYGSLIVETMCDSLFELDHDTGSLLPALVERWKSPNASQLVAKLRKDLKFSDGSGVTAEDVTTSYARVAKSETGSPVADVLDAVLGWDRLRELPPSGEDPSRRDELAGVHSPEPTSVEIGLSRKAPDYFTVLSHPLGSVIPYERFLDDPEAMERQPVCVGPYRLEEPWAPGQPVIKLVRSPAYHGRNAAYSRGGQGWADIIEFHVAPDAAAMQRAFAEGRVDLTYLADDLVRAARQERPGDLVVAGTPVIDYLGLPVKSEPWSKPEVRRALSLVLDRQALADAAFSGVSRPATGFVPSSLASNYASAERRSDLACASGLPASGDVEAAKDALRAAGVELSGSPVTLTFNDEHGNRRLIDAVAEQLRVKLGISVTVQPQNWENYLTTATSTTGFVNPFRLSWAEQYPDPGRYLGPLYSRTELSGDNFSRYTSREYEDHMEDAQKKANADDRYAAYLQAESVLCTDLPMVPLLFGGRAYLVRGGSVSSAVKRMTDETTGQPLLREMLVRP